MVRSRVAKRAEHQHAWVVTDPEFKRDHVTGTYRVMWTAQKCLDCGSTAPNQLKPGERIYFDVAYFDHPVKTG